MPKKMTPKGLKMLPSHNIKDDIAAVLDVTFKHIDPVVKVAGIKAAWKDIRDGIIEMIVNKYNVPYLPKWMFRLVLRLILNYIKSEIEKGLKK